MDEEAARLLVLATSRALLGKDVTNVDSDAG